MRPIECCIFPKRPTYPSEFETFFVVHMYYVIYSMAVIILLQDDCNLLSEEQRSQLKQLQESKNLDEEVLIPVSSVLLYHYTLLTSYDVDSVVSILFAVNFAESVLFWVDS